MAPSLETLPAELVEKIAWKLIPSFDALPTESHRDQGKNVYNFRLSCSAIERKSRRCFSRSCLRIRSIKLQACKTSELLTNSKTLLPSVRSRIWLSQWSFCKFSAATMRVSHL